MERWGRKIVLGISCQDILRLVGKKKLDGWVEQYFWGGVVEKCLGSEFVKLKG